MLIHAKFSKISFTLLCIYLQKQTTTERNIPQILSHETTTDTSIYYNDTDHNSTQNIVNIANGKTNMPK